jgi:hypothetical protein
LSRAEDAGATWLGRAIAAVRVNAVHRDPRGAWIKRRRFGMDAVIAAGNLFLKWSHSRIVMFTSCAAWQAREVTAACALHGEGAAWVVSPRAVGFRSLPGESLRDLLARDALTPDALVAAGRELARAHAVNLANGAFSHGDPHTGNALYDRATGRARLIDFETEHEPDLSADERHADDLLVLLLDLLGRSRDEAWPTHARALLDGYARPEVLTALDARLVVPRGLERALWATRTEFLATNALGERIAWLRGEVRARATR